MTGTTDNTVLYYDFVGRHGYLAQLFEYEGAYICQKLQSITIPGSMLELELFRSSLKHMFIWKAHMINLGKVITLVNLSREQQFQLADVSSTTSPPCSPPSNIQAVKVYFSPSNASKGARSMLEEDQE